MAEILSVSINATAWQSFISVSGMGLSGAYNLGLGENNSILSPNQPKIIFTVNSSGYNDSGVAIPIQRTIYGTSPVRLPYPNESQKDEFISTGNVIVKVALSDYIYTKDSNVTVNILSGFYSSGSLSNDAATDFSVTNNSELDYPKVIGNWTWPNYDVISGGTFKLRCAAFHRSAQSGRPVRAIKFTAQDTNNNAVTGWVTGATIDSTIPDQVKVIEYISELSSSNLTQGARVSGNFVAYPWYGDSGSLLDTSDGANAHPTPHYAPITLLCDKNQTYGKTIVIVNSVTGNDALGTGVDSSIFNPSTPPMAYATIGSAATGIRNYNNTVRGRNNVGLGVIYLQSGNHALIGRTVSQSLFGSDPDTYITIATFPNDSRENVNITGGLGTANIQEKMKFQNVSFTGFTANTFFNGMDYLWFDSCYFNLTGGNGHPINTVPVIAFTHNEITSLKNGLASLNPNSQGTHPSLVRGNNFNNYGGRVVVYTCIGNLRTGNVSGASNFFIDVSGSAVKLPINSILAYNKIYNINTPTINGIDYDSCPETYGRAIVQNLIEKNVPEQVAGLGNVCSTSADVNPFRNVLIWHNTFAGERQQMFYNDGGSTPYFRGVNVHIVNNVTENYGFKTDTFPAAGGDSNRTGNWTQDYSVGHAGNSKGKINASSSIFPETFMGIDSITGINLSTGYYRYISPGAVNNRIDGTGHGDYKLLSDSPLIGLPLSTVLPYDIDGRARSTDVEAAGIYAFNDSDFGSTTVQIAWAEMELPEVVLDTSNAYITGVSRLQNSYDSYSTGLSRITNTYNSYQTGVSRITNSYNTYVTGVSRITNFSDTYQTGISRIQNSYDSYVTGVSRVTNSFDDYLTGISRIANSYDSYITGISRITKSFDSYVTGISRITNDFDSYITGQSRVQNTYNAYITGVSKIQDADTVQGNAYITGVTRITNTYNSYQTGVSRIENSYDSYLTGLSRISVPSDTYITGNSRITAENNTYLTGQSRITNTYDAYLTGISRIQNNYDSYLTGISRVTTALDSYQTGVSRITNSYDGYLTGISRISEFSDSYITGISSIVLPNDSYITGVSLISNTYNSYITGKSSIARGGVVPIITLSFSESGTTISNVSSNNSRTKVGTINTRTSVTIRG